MTDKKLNLDEIEARANAATPGIEVIFIGSAEGATCAMLSDPERRCVIQVDKRRTFEDAKPEAEFIIHARTDIPALIAEVRRLQTCDRGRFVCDAEIARLETDLRAAIVGVGLVDNEVNIRRVKHLEAQDKAHREAGENMSAETAALHKELHAAREALREIEALDDWRCDPAAKIARKALGEE